jgi:serine protease Do
MLSDIQIINGKVFIESFQQNKNMDWSVQGDKWKNSVLQLKVVKALYKASRPYGDPNDKTISGSAFIIDIERGHVITNAHVVSNAISIVGRVPKLGKRDISLELIGICKEKDLALCKIHHDDIKLMTRGMKSEECLTLNMQFGDNMELKETDEVMTIGYPLGQENIKYTTGIVSGFETKGSDDYGNVEDAKHRSPSYIQITAAINPGNSGGPLLNKKGEIVGINAAGYLFAQNIGYAIPSRTFLSIYSELLKTKIVKMPTLALEWNKTNRELMKLKTGNERTYGIYVRNVYADSCLDQLEEGDIIKRLNYIDSFWATKDSFCVNNKDSYSLCNGKTVEVLCYFDRYGDSDVCTKTADGKIQKLIERKMGFSEIMDMVPIGTDISIEICRNGDWYLVQSKYLYKESNRVPRIYPRIDPIDFEIFAGICCANLNMDHVDNFDNLVLYTRNPENRYKKQVVICQVFPDTEAARTQVLSEGYIIDELNGNKIETLDDIRKILRTKPDIISIKTKMGCFFMVSTEVVIIEDKRAMQNFNIRNHNYLLDSIKTQ